MNIKEMFGSAWSVLTSPATFYRNMHRSGGLFQPAIFVVLMSLSASVVCWLFDGGSGLLGSLIYGLTFGALKLVAGAFVAGSLLFFLWQRLGSACSYETSLRVVAYSTALVPVLCLLQGIMGDFGLLVTLLWWANVMTIASVESHALPSKPALWFFIGLALLIFLFDKLGHDENYEDGDRITLHEQFDETLATAEPVQPKKTTGKHDLGVSDLASTLSQADDRVSSNGLDSPTLTPEQQRQLLASSADSPVQEDSTSNDSKSTGDNSSDSVELNSASSLSDGGATIQLGEMLGDVVQQVGKAAENIGQGIGEASEKFKEGLAHSMSSGDVDSTALTSEVDTGNLTDSHIEQSSALQADDTQPELATKTDSSENASLAETAGATLGTVVQELTEIVEGVEEGYKRAVSQDDNAEKQELATEQKVDKKSADKESQNHSTEAAWTPQELGEAMAKFVLELDSGPEQPPESSDYRPGSAAESLDQFLEAYRRSLESQQTQ